MQKNLSTSEALNKMQNLCSGQEKCISDITQKLKTLKINNSDISEIIDNLIDNNFLNEERFAIAFANDKIKFNKWGLIKIKYELKSKRIKDNDIATAFSLINQDDYKEMQILELTKKIKSISDEEDKQKLKSKMYNFAQSRGYDTNLTKIVIEKNTNND